MDLENDDVETNARLLEEAWRSVLGADKTLVARMQGQLDRARELDIIQKALFRAADDMIAELKRNPQLETKERLEQLRTNVNTFRVDLNDFKTNTKDILARGRKVLEEDFDPTDKESWDAGALEADKRLKALEDRAAGLAAGFAVAVQRVEAAFNAASSLRPRKDGQVASGEARGGTLQLDQPLNVQVFEVPPPTLSIGTYASTRELQNDVNRYFPTFKWPPVSRQDGQFECAAPNQPGNLSPAQRFAYHYMHPNTGADLNLLLYHSAGAGKTAAMMAIASLFNRRGYKTLIITTKKGEGGLLKSYLKAAFDQLADFNVQNYLAYKGHPTVAALVAEENGVSVDDVSLEDVIARGLNMWAEMGVVFNAKYSVLDPDFFERTARGVGIDRIKFYAKGQPEQLKLPREKRDDLRRTVVLLDEAHVLARSDKNYASVQEAMWKSRDLSGALATRVVLATATPVAPTPVVALRLLNLLAPRNQAVSVQTMDEFMNRFWDKKNNAATGTLAIDELIRGRVSYLNLTADRAHFAGRNIRWVPVYFSSAQEEGVAECFAGVQLEFNPVTKRWRKTTEALTAARKQQKVAKAKAGKKPSQTGAEWLSGTPGSDPDTPSLSAFGTPVESEKSIRELRRCLQRTSTFVVQQNRNLLQSILNAETGKVIDGAVLERLSPTLSSLLSNMTDDTTAAERFLANSPYPTNEGLKSVKSFVYCDTDNKDDDKYGVLLVAALLRLQRNFVPITRKVNGVPVLKSESELALIPAYRGILVLDRVVAEKADVAALKSYFNDTQNNADGRRCAVVLANGDFREGHDLADVSYVYVLGRSADQADLTQAVARAFRNCRSTHVPFRPKRDGRYDIDDEAKYGHSASIKLFVPTMSDASPYAGTDVDDMVDMLNGTEEKAAPAEWMTRQLQENAVDLPLMAKINKASAQSEEKLRPPPARHPTKITPLIDPATPPSEVLPLEEEGLEITRGSKSRGLLRKYLF